MAVCARNQGIPNLVLPIDNAAEAAVVEGLNVFGVRHLSEVMNMLERPQDFAPTLRTAANQAPAETSAPVKGNRELVSQALANLVDNAIKYAEPHDAPANGALPEIVVRALNDGDRILLSVADSGPGIPDADRGRVVERFVRLEQSRSQPGSGLGLSLASAVARLHGGELTLTDNHPGLKSVIALPRGGPVQSAG